MKLYYSPGACSLGIHVLLEEIGKPYDLEQTNLRLPPPERSVTPVNPKARVPTLVRDDGSVLTEYPAIALWLARSNPDAKLMPEDLEGEVRTVEAMDYCVSTLHMQGFARLFQAAYRAKGPEDKENISQTARDILGRAFPRVEAMLDGKEWLTGSYSAADSALFYVCRWAGDMNVELSPHMAAHFARMNARPAVQRTLTQEGLA
jgi:glutathione S-transferase